MNRNTKLLCIIISLLALISGGIYRYITLNSYYTNSADYKTEVFGMGEIVPFGENYLNTDVCFNGYSIRVDKFEIVDTEEYLSLLPNSNYTAGYAKPERLALVYVTLFNDHSNAEGVMLTELGFHSIDNYVTMDWDLLQTLNPVLQVGYGISLSPNTSYNLVLPFALFEKYFASDSWKDLDACTFYLHVTGYPVEKDIFLQ